MIPTFDFEFRGDAGYVYDYAGRKWGPLPGFSKQKKGLPAVGLHAFVEHYSFRPLLLAYDLTPELGGATVKQWELGQDFDVLQPLFAHLRAGGLIEGHYVATERVVWNRYCVPVYDWPPITIEQTRCSSVKSRAAGYPSSLGDATAVLKTPIQKDPEGKRLMKIFSMPHKWTKKIPRTHTQPREAPEEWARYKSYNVDDIVSASQLSARCPDLTPSELRLWFLDQQINDRGMAVDRKGVKDCIAVVNQAYAKYGAEHIALTGGIKPTELLQMKKWLAARGVHMYDMTEKTIDETADKLGAATSLSPEQAGALRALRIRQVLASASVKKLFALDAMTARDGRVREMYMMHATHHGRTGGYGPQPANLYKGEWHTPEEVNAALTVLASRSLDTVERAYPKLSALDVVNNCLRSLFVAAPGHTLISSDYSAIEGVVLAALAGESWVLEVFHTHGMIYEAQIARMIGVPFEDFVKHRVDTGGTATYGPDGKLIGIKGGKHHPLRQQGKLAVLSGGYASWINGWKKFGADEYYDGDREIKAAIMSYRNSVPAIVEFWGGQTRDKFRNSEREELYGLEGAAIAAVLKPGECFRVGAIALQMGGDTLYMQLPSGRTIPYHSPRLRPATRDYASPWELALTYEGWNSNPEKGPPAWIEMDLYGGVLTQNATGGTARDIQMHGMENVTAAGYPIVMHTYDETVAEVPLIETLSAKSVAGLEQGLNDLPAYAKGWPIFAKGGWLGPRYGKWD